MDVLLALAAHAQLYPVASTAGYASAMTKTYPERSF